MTSYYDAAIQPELVILTANSGIFVTEQGTSTTFTGILTKELTLSTQEQKDTPAISRVADERMVGGKMLHRGIARHPKYVAQHMKKMSGAGYVSGVSGAGYSPPPQIGGMMHKKSKLHKLIR
jgi:hypothetical protein